MTNESGSRGGTHAGPATGGCRVHVVRECEGSVSEAVYVATSHWKLDVVHHAASVRWVWRLDDGQTLDHMSADF